MRKLVENKIKELESIVTKKWGDIIIPKDFVINYDLDSVRALGMVRKSSSKIEMRLNPKLLNEFKELYIDEVVVHEYAHLIVDKLYPTGYNNAYRRKVQSHGREFKNVCSLFGIEGSATTKLFSKSESLKTTQKSRRTVEYSCECDTHLVTPLMHTKITRGAVYTCKKCKCKLEKKN
jgi:SprT protein